MPHGLRFNLRYIMFYESKTEELDWLLMGSVNLTCRLVGMFIQRWRQICSLPIINSRTLVGGGCINIFSQKSTSNYEYHLQIKTDCMISFSISIISQIETVASKKLFWSHDRHGKSLKMDALLQSNLVIRNFLVTSKMFLKVKCSLLPIVHY